MTQSPDHHEETADALKAIADGTHKGGQGTADGFVGPDEPEESEEDLDEKPKGPPPLPDATGYDLLPDPDGAAAAPPALPTDLASRRRRTADFDQRARQAHAHQYKTVMIPLLLTLGVILLLMGLWVVLRGGEPVPPPATGDPPAAAAPQDFNAAFQKWFPLLAFPLGAFLLAGAWWFHQDVTRKKG